jgi:hypothetical protein
VKLRWRDAEASVEDSTLLSQGALTVFQGLGLDSTQITHHLQCIRGNFFVVIDLEHELWNLDAGQERAR